MKNNTSMSVVIAAYNEETSIETVVGVVEDSLRCNVSNYEVFIVNDASTDKTGLIIDKLAAKNPNIKAIHNSKNMNLGYCVWRGLKLSKMDYFSALSGDDNLEHGDMRNFLRQVGKSDMILSYPANTKCRKFLRRFVSKTFVKLLNVFFGLNINYYNGPAIFPTHRLKSYPKPTFSFACIAEYVIRTLKDGSSFSQVPISFSGLDRKGLNLSVFRLRNCLGVLSTIVRLFYEFRFCTKKGHCDD